MARLLAGGDSDFAVASGRGGVVKKERVTASKWGPTSFGVTEGVHILLHTSCDYDES